MTLRLVFAILAHIIDFTAVALDFLPLEVIKIFPEIGYRFIRSQWKVGILSHGIGRVFPRASRSSQLGFRLKLHSAQLGRRLLWIGGAFSLLASVRSCGPFLDSVLCYGLLTVVSRWAAHFDRNLTVVFLWSLAAEVVGFQVLGLFFYVLVLKNIGFMNRGHGLLRC